MTGDFPFACRGRKTIHSTHGPVRSALNHILYRRRRANIAQLSRSSASSVTTASGAGGVRPYISRSKIETISARRTGHSSGPDTRRPSAKTSGSSRAYGRTFDSS